MTKSTVIHMQGLLRSVVLGPSFRFKTPVRIMATYVQQLLYHLVTSYYTVRIKTFPIL